MLTRKPRVNETLIGRDGTRYTVDHFTGPDDTIVVLRYPDGRPNWAIWLFKSDGTLNQFLSHEKPDAPCEHRDCERRDGRTICRPCGFDVGLAKCPGCGGPDHEGMSVCPNRPSDDPRMQDLHDDRPTDESEV